MQPTNNKQSIHEALQHATSLLTASDSARLDAELLLSHVLQQPREYLHTWPERELSPAQHDEFMTLIYKRRDGWPVAYLTGHQAFWSLDLLVTPATLIPRPETELLVETVLQIGNKDLQQTILDLGTGSGAIALAIAKEKPKWQVHAVDASADALAIAQQNAQRNQISNVSFHHSNWCASLPADLRADIIVSNPPYIPENDPHLSQGDVRFEPRSALTAGPDGLDAIRAILTACCKHMQANGWVVIEHGYDQAGAVKSLFSQSQLKEIQQYKDLAGYLRVTAGQLIDPNKQTLI